MSYPPDRPNLAATAWGADPRATTPLRIALLGAESTGKSELALALAQTLTEQGIPTASVAEYLREWCDAQGRTPRPHEQPAIAQEQARRVLAIPANQAQVVIADTTPLMTAIYSDLLFHDASLYPFALTHQRLYDATLITGLDVAWVADGLQRDGPHVRDGVDRMIRQHLDQADIPYAVVYGLGPRRLAHALQGLKPVLSKRIANYSISAGAEALFHPTPSETQPPNATWHWVCERCGDAQCEHLSRRLKLRP